MVQTLGDGFLDLLAKSGLALCVPLDAVDEALSDRVFGAVVRLPLVGGGNGDLQPLRDLDNVRSFLSGMGPNGGGSDAFTPDAVRGAIQGLPAAQVNSWSTGRCTM